jgi:hypothetical protein
LLVCPKGCALALSSRSRISCDALLAIDLDFCSCVWLLFTSGDKLVRFVKLSFSDLFWCLSLNCLLEGDSSLTLIFNLLSFEAFWLISLAFVFFESQNENQIFNQNQINLN